MDLCVGGLGFIGYLSVASELMYTEWGVTMNLNTAMTATSTHIVVGVLSAIVDNIRVVIFIPSLTFRFPSLRGQTVAFYALTPVVIPIWKEAL